MCAVMIIWGFVLIGAGFCRSFIPMVITRVLLGALEAPVAPGNFIIMTMWYTREEQPIRAGLFYTGTSYPNVHIRFLVFIVVLTLHPLQVSPQS